MTYLIFALIKHFHLNEMHFIYIVHCSIFFVTLKSIYLTSLSFRTARNVVKKGKKTKQCRRISVSITFAYNGKRELKSSDTSCFRKSDKQSVVASGIIMNSS